jgi:hypothetical protein
VASLAGVAQLVEQLIRNQQVTRSSRVAGSKILSVDPMRDGRSVNARSRATTLDVGPYAQAHETSEIDLLISPDDAEQALEILGPKESFQTDRLGPLVATSRATASRNPERNRYWEVTLTRRTSARHLTAIKWVHCSALLDGLVLSSKREPTPPCPNCGCPYTEQLGIRSKSRS